MSVMFDLTIAGPELFDSVIFMDNSPALSAFQEEIGKIITDLDKKGSFGQSGEIDIEKLLTNSSDTLLHMQRAYLIWSFNEDYGKKPACENSFIRYMKLFIKSQEKTLVELNGGSKLIEVGKIEQFKKDYLALISSKPEVYSSVKDFFAGYVYGFFFNYVEEQTIMKNYAEMLVCLAIISNIITTTATQKQKTMPKMASLLNDDRFKFISGEIPFDIIMNIVCERFDFTGITPEETAVVKDALKDYISANYDHEGDGLISDKVVTDVMTRLNPSFVNTEIFAEEIYKNSYTGTRTFLDTDADDTGDFNAAKIASVISAKCASDFNDYYSSGRDGIIDVALGSDLKGYKYPLVYKDEKVFMFADIFKELIFPAADKEMFTPVKADELPLKDYPFTEATLSTNIIRVLGGLKGDGFSIRADKKPVLDEIKMINKSKSISDDEKRMLILEKTLYLVSGNMETGTYQRLINDCIFGTSIYDEYIRYRMDCLFTKGVKDADTKKKLLDNINSITE